MGGVALDFFQLAPVFQVDFPNNGRHGLARAAVLTRKEDTKGRGDDQANQAEVVSRVGPVDKSPKHPIPMV